MWRSTTGGVPGYTPSGMNVPGRVTRHVMSETDIQDVIDAFARGAASARELGLDADFIPVPGEPLSGKPTPPASMSCCGVWRRRSSTWWRWGAQ
jgi:hypothetical protein